MKSVSAEAENRLAGQLKIRTVAMRIHSFVRWIFSKAIILL